MLFKDLKILKLKYILQKHQYMSPGNKNCG